MTANCAVSDPKQRDAHTPTAAGPPTIVRVQLRPHPAAQNIATEEAFDALRSI